MTTKKIPAIITVLFFSLMIFLTILARDIHNRMIPNVTVGRLTKEDFELERTLEDGTIIPITKQCIAVPKHMYDNDFLYIIVPGEKNGDQRTFVRKISLQVGAQNDKYYEITDPFFDMSQSFIMESNKEIQDGIEVYVRK